MPQAIPAALLIFTSVGLTGTTLAVATYVGAALITAAPIALTLGASAYANYQAKKALQNISDPNNLQSILKQAIPPQRLCLGTVTTGGALFFYQAKKPYVWMGILLAAHEVDALDKIIVNGTDVFIDSNGFATSAPFSDGSNVYLKVSFRNGSINQAIDPIIAADFPTMPSTFRQRGHATLVIRAYYGYGSGYQAQDDDHKRIYGDQGLLQPLTRFRGAKCYDPRKAGHVLADPSTWTWTDNAPITLGRYLNHQWPDTRLVDPARINWDRLARCADEADRWEISKDGTTFRRNTVNGVVQSTDNPFDVIENFKIAMGGHVILDRGKIYPVARSKRDPVATLHQQMIVGGLEFTSEPRDRELVNIVKPTFVAPDREYQEVGGPVLRRADLIAIDGKPRETSLRGALVEKHQRMQRLASATLKQARIGRTLTVGSTIEALSWAPGDVIQVWLLGSLARVNGLYELASKQWDDRLRGYRLSFIGYDPTVNDFRPEDEQDFTLDSATLNAQAA